jgi:hypothetical protein
MVFVAFGGGRRVTGGVTTGLVVRRTIVWRVFDALTRCFGGVSRRCLDAARPFRRRSAAETLLAPVTSEPSSPIVAARSWVRVSLAASTVTAPVTARAPAVRPQVIRDTSRRARSRSRETEEVMAVMVHRSS